MLCLEQISCFTIKSINIFAHSSHKDPSTQRGCSIIFREYPDPSNFDHMHVNDIHLPKGGIIILLIPLDPNPFRWERKVSIAN